VLEHSYGDLLSKRKGRRSGKQVRRANKARPKPPTPAQGSPAPPTVPRISESTVVEKVRAPWLGNLITWGPIIMVGIVTAVAIINWDGDLFYSLNRVGPSCVILLVIVVVLIKARHKILPMPTRLQVFFGFSVCLLGASAVGASLVLASVRESTEEAAALLSDASDSVDFSGIVGPLPRFDDQDLSHSNFQDAQLTGGGFAGADLSESDFRGASFVDVDFSGADLCAVDARGANFAMAVNLADVGDWGFFVYDEETYFRTTSTLPR
jgi:Pentapeptide repeats (8 copies)